MWVAKKPNVPCADCGKLLWGGSTSLPPGQRRCRDCRSVRPNSQGNTDRVCPVCTTSFRSSNKNAVYCSLKCVPAGRVRDGGQRIKPRPCVDCTTPVRNSGTIPLCSLCARDRERERLSKKSFQRRSVISLSDMPPGYERGLRRQAKRCLLCSVQLSDDRDQPDSKHLDHIVPIAIGGTHTVGNVRIICRTCNLRRPKDGSDLEGYQPTLWSQARESLPRRRIVRPQCQCGQQLRAGRCRRCTPPTRRTIVSQETGQQAATMRSRGLKWQEISDALGLSGPGSAYQVARRFGSADVVALWPGQRQLDRRPVA